MPLSARARNVPRDCLGGDADLDHPQDVARASYDRLRTTWGCGAGTLREIRLWLRARGHDLTEAPAPRSETRRTWIDHGFAG